jgi:hypothetical protein
MGRGAEFTRSDAKQSIGALTKSTIGSYATAGIDSSMGRKSVSADVEGILLDSPPLVRKAIDLRATCGIVCPCIGIDPLHANLLVPLQESQCRALLTGTDRRIT